MEGSDAILLSFLCSVLFAAVHLFAGKLRFLEGIPRSRWLSFAGGLSVSYVFMHLLPELSAEQETFGTGGELPLMAYLEHHVYLIALVGLTTFYGLERAALRAREEQPDQAPTASSGVFWLHVASFSAYNILIGYLLLHREDHTVQGLLWYAVAMGLHFLVNDFGLRAHHKHTYHRIGRWVLAAAVLAGWGLGLLVEVGEPARAAFFAFLAGGVVLNVLKEELPEKRKSRFWAFAAGILAYTALLLASA